MGDDDEPFMAAAGEFACWFFCDFPGLLDSDFDPDCRTLTPRINCEIHLVYFYYETTIKIREINKKKC